jgi:hypothetical protein
MKARVKTAVEAIAKAQTPLRYRAELNDPSISSVFTKTFEISSTLNAHKGQIDL